MLNDQKKVLVGYITSVHGIKGEVKVKSLASNLFGFSNLYKSDGSLITLNLRSSANNIYICSIEGVKDRNSAENYKNTELFALRSDFPEIEEGEFYVSDLIGLDVVNINDNIKIGIVKSVDNFGAGDICEIKFLDSNQEFFPFNNEVFPKVDIPNGKIYCNIPNII